MKIESKGKIVKGKIYVLFSLLIHFVEEYYNQILLLLK